MYMWMKWNWNILMFLCQPIFLNLRHIFEDFLLTALIKKSEYDSKLTKNNILWNIQFLLRKRRGLFSELAYQYFCQICSNDHTSELGNSPTFPLFIIIIVQFSSFEKYHSHHSQVRSLFVIDDLLAHSCCWDSNDVTLADSEEDTNLHLDYIPMLMLRQTCNVTVVGSYHN